MNVPDLEGLEGDTAALTVKNKRSEPREAVKRETRVLGKRVARAVVVLASENATAERGPDGRAEALRKQYTQNKH